MDLREPYDCRGTRTSSNTKSIVSIRSRRNLTYTSAAFVRLVVDHDTRLHGRLVRGRREDRRLLDGSGGDCLHRGAVDDDGWLYDRRRVVRLRIGHVGVEAESAMAVTSPSASPPASPASVALKKTHRRRFTHSHAVYSRDPQSIGLPW